MVRLVTAIFDSYVVVLATRARVNVLALNGSRPRLLELNRALFCFQVQMHRNLD